MMTGLGITRQLRALSVTDTFYIFGVFKIARIFDKKLEHDA